MSGFVTAARELASRLYSSKSIRPLVGRIPDAQVFPREEVDQEIVADRSYFTVVVNELFLTVGRELWATFDPMVLATVEYLYDGKLLSIPTIVGPGLIKLPEGHEAPHGLVINDIQIAGPHPYRGGKVGVTILLYKIKHTDFAQSFLKLAENVSRAAGVPANVDAFGKVGTALIDGLDNLLKIKGNEPVAGHMFTIDGSSRRGFRTGYAALIADPDVKMSSLRVTDGKLEQQNGAEFSPYRAADYVLYSVTGRPTRGEFDSLPFRKLLDQSIQAALGNEEESWKRAKAGLLSLYGLIATSPDLVQEEAESLFDQYTKRVLTARDRAKGLQVLSVDDDKRITAEADALKQQLNARANLLDL